MKNKLFLKIVKESLPILLVTSFISSLGGVGLEFVSKKLFLLLPFLITIPALNDLIGDFGGIISSRLTTLLYLGEVKKEKVKKLFLKIVITAFFSSLYLTFLSICFCNFQGVKFPLFFHLKLALTTVFITFVLISLMFLLANRGSVYVYKKGQDPDNYLIPLVTSIADFLTITILVVAVKFLF